MNRLFRVLAIGAALALTSPAQAAEPAAEKVELKDGSVLFLHPDGTGRMVDAHGKAMTMADGVPMEAVDGRIVMMHNKWVWVRYGPPGKDGAVRKPD